MDYPAPTAESKADAFIAGIKNGDPIELYRWQLIGLFQDRDRMAQYYNELQALKSQLDIRTKV